MSTNRCPQCGTTLFGKMVSRCYKCGSSVDFHSETDKQRQAAAVEAKHQKANDPALIKKYSTFYQALQTNAACIYYSSAILRGNEAWEVFVTDVLDHGTFTCFWCSNCNFLHVANYGPGDVITASIYKDRKSYVLYSLSRRGDGCFTAPDNWVINFTCLGCGLVNREIPTTISYDGLVNKRGDPFLRDPAKNGRP
jgi:hypothetical protein